MARVTRDGKDHEPPGSASEARQTLARVGAARRPGWPAGRVRRRPSGADRAPRRAVSHWVPACGVAFVVAVVLLVLVTRRPRVLQSMDGALAGWLATAEGHPDLAEGLAALGPALGYRVLWIPTALVLALVLRWRHLLVYLGSISVMAAFAQIVAGEHQLARVLRTGVIGSPEGLSLPAWPVIVLSTIAVGSLFALAPSGPARRWGWAGVAVVLLGFIAARVALELDAFSVAIPSAVIGGTAAGLVFGLLAPEAEYPVTYRRQVKAHLRLDDTRIVRVRTAVRDQLGIELAEIRPYRLDGSAGSTPCRLRLADGPPEYLFGKLYARNHLRSDRWYKWARVLRYGRIEDEAPFSSVRRLVEHEDYMLRLLRDGGVRVPQPVGVVEVVPGAEYLLVTELVPNSVEILEATVDDDVIDDALHQVRQLWSAGAAHRDIKPSNVLVQGGSWVYLIDVSFGELRPSRWRQAADLANMLLTLGLAVGPERVVQRALDQFEAQELAEAFATASSLTIPRQLGRRLTAADGDLVQQFCALLPEHPHIRVQRWSLRRVLLAVAAMAGGLLVLILLALNLQAGGLL
jgi:tRNA A-37 threonylcarbamoyl transferase component Bud32